MVGVSAAALLLSVGTASANPGAVAAATAVQGQMQGQAQGQGQGQGQSQRNTGSVSNKSGDSRALGVALGQAPTAAQDCLKGTKFLFGLLEWTDDSSKCENYAAARIAENAAARADNLEESDYYMKRANELRARAEGLSIPSPTD